MKYAEPHMSIKTYKDEAILAAKELFYSDEILLKIENAATDNEIAKIMISARNAL